MPSNKMIEAACEALWERGIEARQQDIAITAAIDAAWTRYDAEDEGTRPADDNSVRLCWSKSMGLLTGSLFGGIWICDGHGEVCDIIAYADPSDIIASWALKDPQLTE